MPVIMADKSQTEPLAHNQVQNNAEGCVLEVDDMNRLRRFLCMGSEGSTYYMQDKSLSRENAESISRLIGSGRGQEVVGEITRMNADGRAAKQDPAIFALAVCARSNDLKTKQAAYKALSEVCRIPTHLFHFVAYAEALSDKTTGWGRSQRKAISKWYNEQDPMKLALAVTKYKQRNGWSHIDLLRLAHVKPASKVTAAIFKYVIKGFKELKKEQSSENTTSSTSGELSSVLKFLEVVDTVKHSSDEHQTARLVEQHQLVCEHLPTSLLNSREVWIALLQHMPLTDLISNLGKLSSLGLLDGSSPQSTTVIAKLLDKEASHASRIHPFNVLLAMKTYEQGKGEKGKLKWAPNPAILEALSACFHDSLKNIEPTNKRYLLAVDMSDSMSYGSVNGSPQITPVLAASAMAMITARSEKDCELVTFSTTLAPVKLNAQMQLADLFKAINEAPKGDVDCAQPMLWALEHKKKVDVFVIYTDSETMAGKIHPAEALRQYRRQTGIWDARLIVCALTSTGFTLADPDDPGMLDIAGFDSAAPLIMKNFVTDNL